MADDDPLIIPDLAADLHRPRGATPGSDSGSTFRRRSLLRAALAVPLAGLGGCSARGDEPLRVAAASDLRGALPVLVAAFRQEHPGAVDLAFDASGVLAEQIRQGAPYDLFLAANRAFVDKLAAEKVVDPATVRPYARGALVLAINPVFGRRPKTLKDLLDPKIRAIALANPDTAPYGIAARQALERQGLWDPLKGRLVTAGSVSQALEFVRQGDAEVGFVGRSLADSPSVEYFNVPAGDYDPIVQYLGVVARSRRAADARAFADFLVGPTGQAMLKDLGFSPAPREPGPPPIPTAAAPAAPRDKQP